MEIEFDFQEGDRETWFALVLLVVVLIVVGLGILGRPVTPYTNTTQARVLTWSDWRFIQAEREYQKELAILRGYADQMITAINSQPNPVAVQLLSEQVIRQAEQGDPALGPAREALALAAIDLRNWSVGVLDRDTSLSSLQVAVELLK